MAQWFYSPSKNGFFMDEIHSSIPEDSIEITEKEREIMIDQMNNHNKKVVIVNDKITFEDVVIPVSWEEIRSKRNRLLRETDYTQMTDWPGNKVPWFNYRKELREIPQKYQNPEDVIWPTPPSE